jgi:hypothetical protein
MYDDGSLNLNGVCPISVGDVERTRGNIFFSLTSKQQTSCGGFNGQMYQEGLKRAFEKGRSQGLPELDISDNMLLEGVKTTFKNIGYDVQGVVDNPLLKPVIAIGGVLLGVNILKNIFFD